MLSSTTSTKPLASASVVEASAAPPPLSRDAVLCVIDDACCAATAATACGWSFRRASTPPTPSANFTTRKYHQQPGPCQQDELLFAIVSWPSTTSSLEKDHSLLTTFYFAYSTWDGRVLYLDEMDIPKHDGTSSHDKNEHQKNTTDFYHTAIRRLLAQIACNCYCNRFTWQQWNHDTYTNNSNSNHPKVGVVPTFLKGWLTLQWHGNGSDDSIQAQDSMLHRGDHPTLTSDSATTFPVQQVIEDCLNNSASDYPSSSFSLRLARMERPHDLEAIGRLVQGLADFENEPDAVHVTLDHYCIDGCAGPSIHSYPLFYCLLLETKATVNKNNNNQATNSTDKSTCNTYICGMAFCYIGCTRTRGRHWYLEDLFLEQPYRGQGGGTYILQTLARVAMQLGCSHLRWQALDWNEPALQFYQKLGARVMDGLETWRWEGKDLPRLASFSISGSGIDEQSSPPN